MLKRWTLWVPLSLGVAVCAWLAHSIGDPFGADLSSFVQAASTVLLVAVTFSYVLATYDMARAANAQLDLAQSEPERQALYTVWQEYVAVRRDVLSLDPQIRVALLSAMHDANELPRALADVRTQAASTASIVETIHRLEVQFPISVRRRIMAVSHTWNALAQTAVAWADFLDERHRRSITRQEPMTDESLKAAWDAKPNVDPQGLPSWDLLFDRDRPITLFDLHLEFDELVRDTLGRWQRP